MKKNMFTVSDKFWGRYQTLVSDFVIPYQRQILGDEIEGIEKSHAIENFKIAAGESEGEFYGMVFQDSDVAKWIEAASYSLMLKENKELDSELDEMIRIIAKAQCEDGYLNTYFTVKEKDHKWQNLHECHELYCSGHMIEAGVAHFLATGKESLLNIVKKNADHIYDTFIIAKRRGVPGHPEIELALVKLFEVTADEKYLELSAYFLNERGTLPEFFEEESKMRDWKHFGMDPMDKLYAQSYAPVRKQMDAVGHAVRAVYLYTGMAGVAKEKNDEELFTACKTLWKSITDKRMYVTGAIGSTAIGEAFTGDYELPNDTAYCETCASVGLIFFAKKMIELFSRPSSEYADIIERALYNTVLAGMSMDGKRFFYVNPLEVNPEYAGKLHGFKHVLPERPEWFGCACCPPNVARLITSLNQYIYSVNNDRVFAHLYVGGEYNLENEFGVNIITKTDYPKTGVINYEILPSKPEVDFKFAIRVPEWSKDYSLKINGEISELPLENGYIYIDIKLLEAVNITLTLDMTPKIIYSNLLVTENSGANAVQRGPLVYCIEGVDNDMDLSGLRIDVNGKITEKIIEDKNLLEYIELEIDGFKLEGEKSLYSYMAPKKSSKKLKAIPYYLWNNRGLNEMKVWIPKD